MSTELNINALNLDDFADKVNALDTPIKNQFLNKIGAMSATPSGDPMHYAYVTAGAEYNDTGADIVKTAPWADLVDDDYTGDYGKTVVHKAGYWYLNGLGDITNDEIREIYQQTSSFPEISNLSERFKNYLIRTNFCVHDIGGLANSFVGGLTYNSAIIILNCPINGTNYVVYFAKTSTLIHIIGVLNIINVSTTTNMLGNSIITCKIFKLNANLTCDSPNLSVKSVLYMISNEAATSPITITLHNTVYNRCMANADVLAALETHTNISLADAGATA